MNDTVLTHARAMCFVASAKPDEAKQFYSDMLGLAFLNEDEYGSMYSISQTLTLRIQKVSELTPQQFTVFGWQVDEIEEAVTRLSQRGVVFLVFGFPTQDARGVCSFANGDKVAWFKDPDGNTLSIAQLAGA